MKSEVVMENVIGKVVANDGKRAEVRFPNGDVKFFFRDVEPEEEFRQRFSGEIKLQCIRMPTIRKRDDLFNFFCSFFSHTAPKHGVAAVETEGHNGETLFAVGMFVELAGVQIFATPECHLPKGGRGFVLMTPEGSLDLTLTAADLEHALGCIAAAFGDRVAVRTC